VLRAPWVERQLGRVFTPQLQPGPVVIAHPVSVVLALLLTRIHAARPLRRVVATVFEPASEYGQPGMDELHQQTVNLLSFQQLPKQVYDVQVAFNMVSRYGHESAKSLSAAQDRILRHYALIAGERVPTPALLLVQAPIFHSHTFALNLQFENPVESGQVSGALTGEHVALIAPSEDSPSNVNAAGQNDILVSLAPDAADASSIWLWAASDNLRVAASTAVECAEEMAAARPRGKIQ